MSAKEKRKTSEAGVPEGATTFSTSLRLEAESLSALKIDADEAREFDDVMMVGRRILKKRYAVLHELAK